MNDSKPTKPKLRWYQFSLRTLLVVTLLAAIGLSWLGNRIQRIRNEISATAELGKVGLVISYYLQENLNELPIPDRWLWKCFGEAPVSCAILGETQISDTDLEHLKGMTSLEELSLDKTRITDTGLEYLKELTSLQELDLSGTRVTDAGLKQLKGMTNLRLLYFDCTNVTDAGVGRLQKALPKSFIGHLPFRHGGPH